MRQRQWANIQNWASSQTSMCVMSISNTLVQNSNFSKYHLNIMPLAILHRVQSKRSMRIILWSTYVLPSPFHKLSHSFYLCIFRTVGMHLGFFRMKWNDNFGIKRLVFKIIDDLKHARWYNMNEQSQKIWFYVHSCVP